METFAQGDWRAKLIKLMAANLRIYIPRRSARHSAMELLGEHNVNNALAAIAAARTWGVAPDQAIAALAEFKGVKRRMQCVAQSAR